MKHLAAGLGLMLAFTACGDNRALDLPPKLSSSTGASTINLTMLEGGTAVIDATATDPEGETLTYAAATPEHGTISGIGPAFQYTPAAKYDGQDHFAISISDGMNTLAVPVTITILAVDDPPVASDGSASTNENQGVAIALVATDIDSTTLTYEIVTQPAHGTLTGTAPAMVYTPSTHYYGTDSFTFRASDGILPSNLATISISIANVITCGDGIREGGEQCDDGNHDNTDGCLDNCMAATCGDGIVQVGVEQCDDGNRDNTDGCLNTCVTASCGDGFVHAGVEQCDDGNQSNTDACLNTCVAATCGDGFVETGVEGCDDGNQIDDDACRNTCRTANCGDGVVGPGEQCDDGNADNTDGCLNTCVVASCGDGFVQAGVEQCDDGNHSNNDACLNTCLAATCGDGFVQAGVEQCDDANSNNNDACLNTCIPAGCGDGFVEAGVEQCDDGNHSNNDACLNTCAAATCGDGFVQVGVEQCDDGNQSNTDACLDTCVAATCGDGFVQAGVEQCDDGNQSNTDACLDTCATATCGDGFVEAGVEQCDDANQIDTDGCHNDCSAPAPAVCGDGHLDPGEECDDGNTADGDGCGHSCLIERCGDGLTQFSRGEQCDDGNTVDGDGCSSTCQVEAFVTTASVMVSDTLSCTTAVANAARKIAVDGSGHIYVTMQCGASADVVVSQDRGLTFSAPLDLSADLPNAPVTIAQVAIAPGPSNTAHVAMMLDTGEVFVRSTYDGGATWSVASSIGSATSTSTGLSLYAFNDDVFVGFSTSGGVSVAINHHRGVGTFDITNVGMSIAYFDLLYDAVQGGVVVVADTPAFHVRVSSDVGATFASEVNPPGQEYYSDWGIGNGRIFVSGINLGASGSSTSLYVIPVSDPTTSTSVSGLPLVSTAQSRTVAGDTAGNAFVASQLNGGGIQLDRLVVDATSFDTARSLGATGSWPIVTALPGNQGAAVVYTDGSSVYVTIQAY